MAARRSIPVSMLSGFLGAGKTTMLRHVLQSGELKVGCIVNDVAAVNIDAKLIRGDTNRAGRGDDDGKRSTTDLADTIELANGCACCSIADELLGSFEKLLSLADARGEAYDRIILENSGVAEPQNIRDQFAEARAMGLPLMERIHLDTLITVVDGSTFVQDYSSRAPLAARPDLGEGGGYRPVVDLLVEQIECADYVVLNKSDLLAQGSAGSLEAIVSGLNPLAQIVRTTQGVVPVQKLFGGQAQALVARLNVEGQHRGAVAAARAVEKQAAEEEERLLKRHEGGHVCSDKCDAEAGTHDGGHVCSDECGHEHEEKSHVLSEECDHEHEEKSHVCSDKCGHEHEEKSHACSDKCGHHHHIGVCGECKEQGHDRNHAEHEAAKSGSHRHQKRERQESTAAKRFGITSFVYARRRPFHPQRLKDLVLKWMPVVHNQAIGEEAPETGDSPIKSVLRSKGFMWIANGHSTAFYWSHAGQHFEIRDEGEWWVAVPPEEWPRNEVQRDTILNDFVKGRGNFGDRRQEIVFIGAQMDEDAIQKQLDGTLLTDEEMDEYVESAKDTDPYHPYFSE